MEKEKKLRHIAQGRLSARLNGSDQPLLQRTARTLYKLIFALVLFIIMAVGFQAQVYSFRSGEIATDDVYYNRSTTSYISELRTEQARNEAAASVGQVFVIDAAVTEALITRTEQYLAALNEAASSSLSSSDKLASLREQLPGTFSNDTLNYMLRLDSSERLSQFSLFETMIAGVYEEGVTKDEVDSARMELGLRISTSTLSGSCELFFKSLLEGMELSYNEAYDAVATRALQDEAMAAVEDVSVTVQSGERLISRGEVISDAQLEALEALGMAGVGNVFGEYIGLLLLAAAVTLLLLFYLRQYQPQHYTRMADMMMLFVVMAVTLLLCRLVSLLQVSAGTAYSLAGYLLPVPSASLLIAVLLDRDTAVVSTIVLSVLSGVIMQGELCYALNALVGGLTATIMAARISQRSQFVNASLWIMLADMSFIAAYGLIFRQSSAIILIGLLFGVINGLVSAILAMGTMPFLESVFGVTTVIRLLELSNLNNPLLKRLMIEAPGTYNHSILVGNLAEAAAEAINANSLLVRVASYYHDVGKLKRPQFFIENQRPGENPHDKLQPALSARIITSHITDGMRMLSDEHFPQEILDIVEQHHGDAELSYFYSKACAAAYDPEDVKRDDYCYRGRRPQTREAALVMLADSVQAGVQALKNADAAAMEQRVQDIVQDKIAKRQLQDSPLTFRDVEAATNSFIMVLSGINHLRIEYPQNRPAVSESAADTDEE